MPQKYHAPVRGLLKYILKGKKMRVTSISARRKVETAEVRLGPSGFLVVPNYEGLDTPLLIHGLMCRLSQPSSEQQTVAYSVRTFLQSATDRSDIAAIRVARVFCENRKENIESFVVWSIQLGLPQ